MSIVIEDLFIDSDNTDLTVHTIAPTNTPATAWVNVSGAGGLSIESNKAQQVSATFTNAVYVVDSGLTDSTVSAAVSVTSNGFSLAGIAFRVVDGNNYYLAGISPDRSTLFVYEVVSGSFNQVASAAWSGSSSTPYTVSVVLSGSTATVKVAGSTLITYTMSDYLTATKCGLWSNIQGTNFADFTVSTGGPPPGVLPYWQYAAAINSTGGM